MKKNSQKNVRKVEYEDITPKKSDGVIWLKMTSLGRVTDRNFIEIKK